jgi:DNA-binding PadR family transcriptional regulator
MRGFFSYHGCARRTHSGFFSGFAAPFGPGGAGGRGFLIGRKLGSETLQLVILALLAEEPRHGYEIIKALELTSRGFYAPSPGMVYPALTYLEETGYATVEQDGTRKRYRITDAGRAKLAEHRDYVDGVLAQLARVGSRMEHVRQAFAGDDAPANADTGPSAVDQARRELRAALQAKLNAAPSAEELQRVAEILRRATDELRKR